MFSSNEMVVKLHKRFGSEVEGTLRDHIYKNGAFRDVVRMGILKEQWINKKADFTYKKIQIEA